MQSAEAKYKVYLHQDVFILNQNFILDVLKVFQIDDQIGILGMDGTRNLGTDAIAVAAWDTGKVLHNFTPQFLAFEEPREGDCTDVIALDGLPFATQYDVELRLLQGKVYRGICVNGRFPADGEASGSACLRAGKGGCPHTSR